MLVGPIMPFWPILPIAVRAEPVWLAVIPSHVKSLRDGLRHFDCEHKTLWAVPLFWLHTLAHFGKLGLHLHTLGYNWHTNTLAHFERMHSSTDLQV